MRGRGLVLIAAITAVFPIMASNDTEARLSRAATVLSELTDAKGGLPAERLAKADCVIVVPGFKKGAAVVGAGYGRGFISCRKYEGWSAPGAVTLETSSLGVQIGGEEIDIVIVSMDKGRREKLLSDRFAVGDDASAAWGNGKSAHEDPSAKILFFGRTKGVFAGFSVDGATLSPDRSTIKALYGERMTNQDIVERQDIPADARPFVTTLASVAMH